MTWSDVLVLVRKFREKQLTPTLNSEDSGAVKSAKSDKILSGPSSPQIKVDSFFLFFRMFQIICFALYHCIPIHHLFWNSVYLNKKKSDKNMKKNQSYETL